MSHDLIITRRSRRNHDCENWREFDDSPKHAFRHYKGNSSTQSNPDNSTQINDTKTAGSEGSIVQGSGSSGSVSVTNISTTTDLGVISAAGDAIGQIAAAAAQTTNDALTAVANASEGSSYNSSQAAIAAANASESASYNAAQAALGAANASAASSEASSYNSSQASQAAVAAAERAAYEAGQVALGATKAASQAASDAAFSASQAATASANASARAAADAINANVDVSRTAIGSTERTAQNALNSNLDVTRSAFGFGSDALQSVQVANDNAAKLATDVLNFRNQDTDTVLGLVADVQKQANDLIRYTNEQFTAKLASNAGDAPQETVKDIVKFVAPVAIVVAGIVALFAFKNKSA